MDETCNQNIMTKDRKDNGMKDVLTLEAQEIVAYKKELKILRRKSNYSRTKLRKYFIEARRLKEEFNFSFKDISLWLRKYKHVKLTPDGVRTAYNRIKKEYDSQK